MKQIVHLGNIANNAYNNSKYLNDIGPYSHVAVSYDNPHAMAYPEWEEIDTEENIAEYWPNWSKFTFRRPEWFHQLDVAGQDLNETKIVSMPTWAQLWTVRRRIAYWLKDQGVKKTTLGYEAPKGLANILRVAPVLPAYGLVSIAAQIARHRLRKNVSGTSVFEKDYRIIAGIVASHTSRAHLVQGYGMDVVTALLSGKPFVAYEHGTLRDAPFDNTPAGSLLATAYKKAQHVFITNPDTLNSARRLGLENISFVPHVVDTDVFMPGRNPEIRKQFNLNETDLVIIAPARQNWEVKRNERLIKAFCKLVDKVPHARLMLSDWGQNRDLTHDLVRRLSLNNFVRYYRPVPKRRSAQLLRAADIVVDQLHLPTFGALTPEALACGKVTLTSFNSSLNSWCYSVQPPIIPINNSEQLGTELIALANDPERRLKLGREGVSWVRREYSISRLTKAQNDVYDKILYK